MLSPRSVAIVGLSADAAKHGGRVLANLRKVGFAGAVWGVNPGVPEVEGVEMFENLAALPEAPDLVVCAIPAAAVPATVGEAGAIGAGGVVVFAGGFAEAGGEGERLQTELARAARSSGVRVLGPNSGGIIRPSTGLAASFLTCLDRPPEQIISGPVGLVTQSGGTGSYVHNLAAAAGDGLAVSISTGNEADLGLADGITALVDVDEVKAIALVMETVRNGASFVDAVRRAHAAGKPVVACRIGTSQRGEQLMSTHTGALAAPAKVLDGVLDALGVTVAETPEEMLSVAGVMARAGKPAGDRIGIVTHSGGIAILLTDLAERAGVALPHPGQALRDRLQPLLQLGSSDNPLDMGAIIGGPARFAQVVDLFARSGDFDCVLAVSTAHPPAHTVERVDGLLDLDPPTPVVHLWMAGDVSDTGLAMLRGANRPVTTEPRAAIRAAAGMGRLATGSFEPAARPAPAIMDAIPRTEHEAKKTLTAWGLPVVEGDLATDAESAARLASDLDGELVMKIVSPAIAHKTEVGGVVLGIVGSDHARRAFDQIVGRVAAAIPDAAIEGVRVERMRAGIEVIVGMIDEPAFGPTAMVGLGGVAAEGLGAERFAPAPLTRQLAHRLVRRVPGLATLLRRHSGSDEALDDLAGLVAETSRWFVASGLEQLEMNPVAWTGERWEILDALVVGEGGRDGQTR